MIVRSSDSGLFSRKLQVAAGSLPSGGKNHELLRTVEAVSQSPLLESFWQRGRGWLYFFGDLSLPYSIIQNMQQIPSVGTLQESLTEKVLDILREMRPSRLQTLVGLTTLA